MAKLDHKDVIFMGQHKEVLLWDLNEPELEIHFPKMRVKFELNEEDLEHYAVFAVDFQGMVITEKVVGKRLQVK